MCADDVRARVLAVAVPWVGRSGWIAAPARSRARRRRPAAAARSRRRSARRPGAPARGARRRRARRARRSSARARSRARAGRGTRARSACRRGRPRASARRGRPASPPPREVDRADARMRVRAAEGVAPEHPRGEEVARVRELAGDLRDPVDARTASPTRPSSSLRVDGVLSTPLRPDSPRSMGGDRVHPPPAVDASALLRTCPRRTVPTSRRFAHRRSRLPRRQPHRVEDLLRSRCSGRGCRRAPRGSRRRSGPAAAEEIDCRDDEPGRAEAALHGAGLDERLLHRDASCPSPASPSTVTISCPSAWAASTRQAQTSVPSSRTEHEPHSPCSHAFFEPGQARGARGARRAGSRPPRPRLRAARR